MGPLDDGGPPVSQVMAQNDALEVAIDWRADLGFSEALDLSSHSFGADSTKAKPPIHTGAAPSWVLYLGHGGLSARVEMLMQTAPLLMGWQQPQQRVMPDRAMPTAAYIAHAPGLSRSDGAAGGAQSIPADAVTADVQMSEIIEHLSLKMSQIAEILGVTRPTAYAYLNGEVLMPREVRTAARLRGLHQLAIEWKDASSVPLGRLWSLPIDDNMPSLLEQLTAPDWDMARLRSSIKVLASLQEDRAARRLQLRERGFGRGRETDSDDRELRRVDDAIRHLR